MAFLLRYEGHRSDLGTQLSIPGNRNGLCKGPVAGDTWYFHEGRQAWVGQSEWGAGGRDME